MTAITRERLDRIEDEHTDLCGCTLADPSCPMPVMAAALRRVLDQADYIVDIIAEALAGTQTDDGAVRLEVTASSPGPAPSSPDRIEAVAQALYGGRRWTEQLPWQVTYWRTMAEVAVAALDAYDREHPTPATSYWKRVADRREESLDMLGRERNTWARQMADLRDERDAANRDAEDARREKNEAQNERDDLDTRLADLRERIAADIEAQSCGSDCYERAARIARGGQS